MTYNTSNFKDTVSTALCFHLYLPKKSNNFNFDMQWHKFPLYLKPLSHWFCEVCIKCDEALNIITQAEMGTNVFSST